MSSQHGSGRKSDPPPRHPSSLSHLSDISDPPGAFEIELESIYPDETSHGKPPPPPSLPPRLAQEDSISALSVMLDRALRDIADNHRSLKSTLDQMDGKLKVLSENQFKITTALGAMASDLGTKIAGLDTAIKNLSSGLVQSRVAPGTLEIEQRKKHYGGPGGKYDL